MYAFFKIIIINVNLIKIEPQEQDRQNMEVLIGNVQFPGLIIPPDADDEAMVELAIALSLQVIIKYNYIIYITNSLLKIF